MSRHGVFGQCENLIRGIAVRIFTAGYFTTAQPPTEQGSEQPTEEKAEETSEAKSDLGHRNMTLDEVQQYQKEHRETYEPGATMSHEDFLKEQEKMENEITGKPDWPDNDGFEKTPTERSLTKGEEFTRRSHTDTVNDDGSFAGEKGISFEESALPGKEEDYKVDDYKVTKNMPDSIVVQEGASKEAFGHQGGGTQMKFQEKILDGQGEQMIGEDGKPLYRNVPMQDMIT